MATTKTSFGIWIAFLCSSDFTDIWKTVGRLCDEKQQTHNSYYISFIVIRLEVSHFFVALSLHRTTNFHLFLVYALSGGIFLALLFSIILYGCITANPSKWQKSKAEENECKLATVLQCVLLSVDNNNFNINSSGNIYTYQCGPFNSFFIKRMASSHIIRQLYY